MARSILEKIFYMLRFDRVKLGDKKADSAKSEQFKLAEKESQHKHRIPKKVISNRFGRAINQLSDK